MIDKMFAGVAVFFLAFLAFGVGILLHSDSSEQRIISFDNVVGIAKAMPDNATISLAIYAETTESKESAAGIFSQANKKLNELFSEYNIEHVDINFENIYTNEWKTQETKEDGSRYEKTTYVMGQELKIKLFEKKFENFSEIMNDLAMIKDISVRGVEKGVENKEKLFDLARENAIEKARKQAESTAHNLGMKLGKVVSLEVMSTNAGLYNVPMMAKAEVANTADSIVGLESEDEYSVNIRVVYEIQ